jgi:hypothetical protein
VAGLPPQQAVKKLREKGIIGSVTPYTTQYVRLAPGLLNHPDEIDTVLKEIRELRG